MAMRGHGLVKVVFDLEPGAWHGYATETVWAEPVGGDRFRIRNVPFYAFGVSAEDIVVAAPSDEGLRFESVSLRAGHSSYRILVLEGAPLGAFVRYWTPLETLGCSYEKGKGLFFAVDVPPNTDIYEAYALFEKGEEDGIWDFEEGHCGHPLK